jgi:hypothetical protein
MITADTNAYILLADVTAGGRLISGGSVGSRLGFGDMFDELRAAGLLHAFDPEREWPMAQAEGDQTHAAMVRFGTADEGDARFSGLIPCAVTEVAQRCDPQPNCASFDVKPQRKSRTSKATAI